MCSACVTLKLRLWNLLAILLGPHGKQVVLVWVGRIKAMGASWEGLKREALNRLGWRSLRR